MYQANSHTYIDEDDQCYTCEYFCKDVACPLLEALAVGVAHLSEDLLVKNCGFYVKFERRLTIVKDEKPEPQR